MTTFDSAIVTLVHAEIGYKPDGELWGAIVVKRMDGPTKLYAQYLPQHPHLDPPGWAAIADITGVGADEVIADWDVTDQRNIAAERAFSLLREEAGKDFLARETDGVFDEKAVELVPIRVDDPTIQLDLNEGQVIEGDQPVQFTQIAAVIPEIDINDLEPPRLVITSEHAAAYSIEIPDADHEPDPYDWFFVETLAGVPAAKMAYSWTQPTNSKVNANVDVARQRLSRLLVGRHAPMTDEGELDLNALRRQLVRDQLAIGIDPKIFGGRNPKRTVANAWTLLKDTCGFRLFRYNVERGANSGLPALIRTVEGQQKLEVLDNKEKMRGVLFSNMDFCGPAKGKAIRHVNPPNVVTEHMITFADQTVPAIDTLVRIPTVRRDGTIHDTEGYDPKSKVWYAPELQLDPIPDRPTDTDVRKALATVMMPIKEFPLIAESGSISATVACLLDQLVRPMIAGPRPIYAFDAPALKGQGTGKTLLATAIGAIITGREIEVTGWPDDPKELPKLITSKLMAGDPFVIFDNLEGVVRHKDLAACATATTWSSRLLHTNETPKLPQTTTWTMTLNGARFSRDIARRTITIKLDAKMADPYKRKGFEIKNLVPWVIQHRAQIIRACLIMVRAWVVAGRPEDPRLNAGSFEAWQTVVGGVLYHAGLKDLPLALEESRERDVDAAEHDEFISRWRDHFSTQQVTALQLAGLAEMYNLYGSVLEKVKAPNWKGRHMADILRKLDGHLFSGWKVEKCESRQNGHFVYTLKSPDDLRHVN